jgi:rhodanese-related sulfurtransferase
MTATEEPVSPQTIDEVTRRARERINRVAPEDLASVIESGGLVVDIRPVAQRREEGEMDCALVVERNVLEWRLDPQSAHRLPEVTDHSRQVVIVCSEGYASSLAAASLRDLGYEASGDLEGGYKAWKRHVESSRVISP